jgi:hypothetical protein
MEFNGCVEFILRMKLYVVQNAILMCPITRSHSVFNLATMTWIIVTLLIFGCFKQRSDENYRLIIAEL